MKIYLAAPWADRHEAEKFAETFLNEYEITRTWWLHECGDRDFAMLREQAEADLSAVCEADAVVVLQTRKSEGKAVETGYAIAMGIPVFVLLIDDTNTNEYGNIFHHHPGVVTFESDLELLGALKAYEAFGMDSYLMPDMVMFSDAVPHQG